MKYWRSYLADLKRRSRCFFKEHVWVCYWNIQNSRRYCWRYCRRCSRLMQTRCGGPWDSGLNEKDVTKWTL